MSNLALPRPRGWSQPKLTGYFEEMWGNQIATFANKEEAHRLCRLDDLMYEIAADWKGSAPDEETVVPLMMFFRSHSAFRAACSLGMAGALVEGTAVIRLGLEFSGYALIVSQNPGLGKVWWDRDVDFTTKKVARDRFKHANVLKAVERADKKIGEIYAKLYDRTIQFGAHPNEKSITSSIRLNYEPGQTEIQQVYLQDGGRVHDHWIRTANQAWICALKVFGFVHHKRYTDLNVDAQLAQWAQGM